MSPASKSKSKEKSSGRTTKEQAKASSKPSATGSTGSGLMASAYNPLSGTFHTLDTAPTTSSPPPHVNGRFRNIDETDDHSSSSLGTGAEYDSVSNNDSCSGESEDLKEKSTTTAPRQEAIPGSDNDKREKIRQKNERKHQRQKERRAQELHERCSGYLMSRKLEALAQQIVGMGFTSEKATMALILNEGRVEDSVAWLCEGSQDAAMQKDATLDTSSNLKIDISEELNLITAMEIKYKCSKQDVERAIVACEGDLEKADEILRSQKQEASSTCPPKPGEVGDPPLANGGKIAVSGVQNLVKPQVKMNGPVMIQQRREENRDFNYTKAASPVVTSPEPVNRTSVQPLRRPQPMKSEWVRPQVPAPPAVEKRWPNGGSGPSVSYSLASPLQAAPPPAKAEPRYVVVGSEVKHPVTGSVREPVVMMQRPQSINAKQSHPATSMNITIPSTAGWYSNSVAGAELLKPNGGLHHIPNANLSALQPQQYYTHSSHQPFASGGPIDNNTPGSGWGNSYSSYGAGVGTAGTLPSPSSSSSLTVPSSLGLFSGWGSTGVSGASSPVDWNTGGSIPQCDYSSIDWTLESALLPRKNTNGLWLGLADFVKSNRMHDSSWSSSAGSNPTMRSNGVVRVQEGVTAEAPSASSTSEGSNEWTNPFAGKDLFSLPRQFVTSPSL